MKTKDICIIGVDDFTYKLAKELLKAGKNVVLIDNDENKVNNLSSEFQYVYKADATNKMSLIELNVGEFAQVIIGVSTMEDSILIVSNLKDLKIKNIVAKVRNEVQKQVLTILTDEKVKIIWPDEVIAEMTAFRLIHEINVDLSLMNDEISIVRIPLKNPKLFQIEIKEFELKSKYFTNIIMIDRGKELIFPVRSTTKLLNGDILTIACKSNTVDKITSLFTKV
ncbi:MAG: TrkA family potassium uptake protein [Ureaplasma sp.]|nr:TrkA family potassium uptake protein [Ureaplasma sp.]